MRTRSRGRIKCETNLPSFGPPLPKRLITSVPGTPLGCSSNCSMISLLNRWRSSPGVEKLPECSRFQGALINAVPVEWHHPTPTVVSVPVGFVLVPYRIWGMPSVPMVEPGTGGNTERFNIEDIFGGMTFWTFDIVGLRYLWPCRELTPTTVEHHDVAHSAGILSTTIS